MNATQVKKLSQAEQYEMLEMTYNQANPDFIHRPASNIREFILSPFYMNLKDECWETLNDMLFDFEQSKKHIAVFIMPPGSGKSYLTSILASYETHKLLCYKDPQKRLALAKGSNISIMNTSQSARQAKKVVFGEINARIQNSNWFKRFAQPNKEIMSELQFANNITILPGTSAESSPYGYNLVCDIMDEVAWWEMTSEKDYVKDIFETIEKRMKNRFESVWDWKIILITNPSYPDRYVESLIDRHDVFGIRKAIWEVKPWLFSTDMVTWNRVKIPKELEREAIDNPDIFKRDRLGIPSETIKPWLVNKTALNTCLNKDIKNIIDDSFNIDFARVSALKTKQCFIHVDLGETGDACGLCLAYKENGRVKVPFVMRMKGSHNNPVRFSDIRQIIISLRDKGANIKRVSYDGWQSIDSKQILQSYGFDCEILSIDRTKEPYATLREMMYDNKLELPFADIDKAKTNPVSAVEYLVKELNELEEYEKKVDHKPLGSKDMTDALAGCVYWCVKEGFDSMPNSNQFEILSAGHCETLDM